MTKIFVTFRFAGLHQYVGAPEPVAYLKHPHRHVFHVRATIEVFHNDRELEFIMVKNDLQQAVKNMYPDNVVGSCEMIAHDIAAYIKKKHGTQSVSREDRYVEVEVSEDGENGAVVIAK